MKDIFQNINPLEDLEKITNYLYGPQGPWYTLR
ncbi:Uncharacterised protein [Mycoplasmopsis citelli]|uniref:Uncharacterized protein n=1 Tax=Mycoplasmopsis citelli TaxID=171281 RepID=A0A449B2V5_9BACT|nr:Uncharacterised protein [Mycoplasmopsis citelli]